MNSPRTSPAEDSASIDPSFPSRTVKSEDGTAPIPAPFSIPSLSQIKMECDEVAEPPAKKSKMSEFIGYALLFYQGPRTSFVTKSDIIVALNSIGLFGIPETAVKPLYDYARSMRTVEPTWMIQFEVSDEFQSKVEEFVRMNQFVTWDTENSRPSKPILCRLLDTPGTTLASLMAVTAKVLIKKDPSSVIAISKDQLKIGPYPNYFTFTLADLLRTHKKEVDKAVQKISRRVSCQVRTLIQQMVENPAQNS